MVRTIIDQAYLIPLPVDLKPVYWTHQNALMLYPQPDLVANNLHSWYWRISTILIWKATWDAQLLIRAHFQTPTSNL